MNSESSVKPCLFSIRSTDTYFLDVVMASAPVLTAASVIPPPYSLHCPNLPCLPPTAAPTVACNIDLPTPHLPFAVLQTLSPKKLL